MFISFEGIDGCGKTTMENMLCEYLKNKNIPFVKTLEPGGTEISNKCRELLLKSNSMDNRCEVMLFLASRAQHVKELIEPNLKKGNWVISDRYADSFFAYQAFGRGFDFDFIKEINDFACYNLYPDKTFYLEIDVETSLNRQTDPDRISSSDKDFYYKIKSGFDFLCEKYPQRFIKINARENKEKVFENILKNLGEV